MRSTGLVLVLVATLAASSVGLETWRDRQLWRGAGGRLVPLRALGPGRRTDGPLVRCDPGRRLLGEGHPALRRHQAVGRSRQAVRPSVSAARHHDEPRPAVQHRLPVRRHLPGRGLPGRAGPSRSGGCAAREGIQGPAGSSGSTCRTSVSSTTGGFRTSRRRRTGSRRRARCLARHGSCARSPRSTLTKGGDRDSSRALWRQLHDTADNDWLRRESERRLLQLDALDAIDALHDVVRAYATRTGRLPATWEALVARADARRPAARPDRHAVRTRSGDRERHCVALVARLPAAGRRPQPIEVACR